MAAPDVPLVRNLPKPAPAAAASRQAPAPPEEAPLLDLGQFFRESPPWLISAIVHMVAVIIMGLIFIAPEIHTDLLLNLGYSEDIGAPLEDDLDLAQDEFELDDQQILTSETLPVVDDPLAMPEVSEVTPQPVFATGTEVPTAIGLALTGREPGMKEALIAAGGGTGKTEGAVSLGLKWLAAQQNRNGLWSLKGPYSDGTQSENVEAATAMALLAFQGAGYTPDGDSSHPFTKVVRRGWSALLKRLQPDGRFFTEVPRTHQLYTQAQCTIALCELYAMTGDAEYRKPAQLAIDYCIRTQRPDGGWKYNDPNEAGDMSVTGWMVMALQSARMAGLEVPSPVFDEISKFLDTVSREGGSQYAYNAQQGAKLALTAEGLLCRQYLGWRRDDPRLVRGVEYMLANLPSWNERNVYYWYYATQVVHHMEGPAWRMWNEEMREMLPKNQEKRGREKGSWDPNGDRWGPYGGRLYVTCLSIYILEVYYRHLPLYQSKVLGS